MKARKTSPRVVLNFSRAVADDARALAHLTQQVAADLTARFGRGHWNASGTEKGALRRIRESIVVLARADAEIVGTLTLQKRKPWAIDVRYFTPVDRCFYLVNMAVVPELQRRGVGRQLLGHADDLAKAEGFAAVRLDAYDADAGAGEFYARGGYREVGRVVYRKVPLIYYERLLL